MDRAYASGASATPPTAPASPSVGYPTKGNPGSGTPATKPGEYWFHMVTEEIRAAIVAGGLTPDQNNTTQLRDAILALIAANQTNDFKASVRVATTANIASLAGGAPNTLDGITLVVGDRILVKDQTTASQNGIYVVATLGTGSNGTWSRATDADAAGELTSGALLAVEVGTANANSLWMLTTDGTITIGTTALTFARQTTVNLATQVTGVLPEANGGVGTTTGSGNLVRATSPTLVTPNIDSAQFAAVYGTAPIYPCRAWVNFNGSGTVAIRASGNISSITINGTGDWTLNFATAMPDGNYAAVFGSDSIGNNDARGALVEKSNDETNYHLAGSLRIIYGYTFTSGLTADGSFMSNVAIFR